MPRRVLTIDSDDTGRFFLLFEDGSLTLGDDPATALALDDLRVVRIHCEVEVEAAAIAIRTDNAAPRALEPGEAVRAGAAQVRLVASSDDTATLPAIADKPPPAAAPTLTRRLLVVDGADQGHSYAINAAGLTSIGKHPKDADIVLHDLYVARVHCDLEADGNRVLVSHREGPGGTRINGKLITERQELHLGDILRVGNSHLRYELGEPEAPAADTVDDLPTYATNDGKTRAAPKPAPAPPPAPDPLIHLENQALGHYQFGALLGRGRSGLVFRAHHRQTNQPVTVKVLPPEFPQGDADLQRFVKALKAAAPLRHPNLVSLYAAGKTGPYCWIAREYIEGESLALHIGRLQGEGKLNWMRACRIAVHLGKALEYLHAQHAPPATLTPSNVLIEAATKNTRLADRVLDTALAGSKLEASVKQKRLLTELPYRAPEQVEPGHAVDHRASLYAVGAIVYAAMTGLPPYAGETAESILAQMHDGRPGRPSRFARDIPPPFEAAVLKLLARRPEDRYQSAADLLAVVEQMAFMHEITV